MDAKQEMLKQLDVAWATIRWLRIAREEGYKFGDGLPSEADVGHSALLHHLLLGHEPLPAPPPLYWGHPYHRMIEEGVHIGDATKNRNPIRQIASGEGAGRFEVLGTGPWRLTASSPLGDIFTFDPPEQAPGRWVLRLDRDHDWGPGAARRDAWVLERIPTTV